MQIDLDDIWLKNPSIDEEERLKSRRRIRIKMVGAVGLSYLMDAFLLFLFAYAGSIAMIAFYTYVTLGLTHVLLFSALHYYGISDHLKNPHLTLHQMIFAICVQLVGMVLAPQILTFFMAIMFIIFAFGALRTSLREALFVWLITCAALVAILLLTAPQKISITHPGPLEVVIIVTSFGLILIRTILLGYYGLQLRLRILKQTRKFERMAYIDPLTASMNRRAILTMYDEQHHLCERKAIPFCVAMLDVDRFKRINDTYGHGVGDRVLKQLVQVIKSSMRVSDKIGRYGGEEFLLILPATKLHEASLLMERIRRDIQVHTWESILPKMSVTISCGICEVNASTLHIDAVACADKALYAAKHGGRNQVKTG